MVAEQNEVEGCNEGRTKEETSQRMNPSAHRKFFQKQKQKRKTEKKKETKREENAKSAQLSASDLFTTEGSAGEGQDHASQDDASRDPPFPRTELSFLVIGISIFLFLSSVLLLFLERRSRG